MSSSRKSRAAIVAGGLLLPLLSSSASESFLFSVQRSPDRDRGHAKHGSEARQSLRPSSEPFSGLAAGIAAVAAAAGLQSLYKAHAVKSKTAMRALQEAVPESRRRDLAFAGFAAAVSPGLASAEVAAVAAPVSAKIQRVVIDVADEAALEKEVKFWTKGCQMKVLGQSKDADGNKSSVVGYLDEKDVNSFALEIKVDPSVKTRKPASLLNWSVMQPTVNALNYVQIGAKESVFQLYDKIESNGGAVMIGDARYMDIESPRGVQLRYAPADGPFSVQLVSLNVEVPAFDATVKFYERTCGMEEIRYSAKAPVQELSVYLQSPVGGPKLLLCPVPDYRIKQRDRDEFVNLLLTSPNSQKVADQAAAAIQFGEEEEKAAIEREKQAMTARGERVPANFALTGTTSRPQVDRVGTLTRLNDGVDNLVFVMDTPEFQKSLA